MSEGIVEFQITGCIGRFRGIVINPKGKYGQPEIRVTERLDGGEWVPCMSGWPILKDGDYIISK